MADLQLSRIDKLDNRLTSARLHVSYGFKTKVFLRLGALRIDLKPLTGCGSMSSRVF